MQCGNHQQYYKNDRIPSLDICSAGGGSIAIPSAIRQLFGGDNRAEFLPQRRQLLTLFF